MFLLSIALPILGIPIVTAIGLSHTVTATLSGICVVGAEVLGVAAVTVMGKTGYNIIKSYMVGFLKRYGPPQKVSPGRYNIGLVMICLPIFVGWITPYVADMVLGPDGHLVLYGFALDLLLLAVTVCERPIVVTIGMPRIGRAILNRNMARPSLNRQSV